MEYRKTPNFLKRRPLVKIRPYMDVLLSLRGVPDIGVPTIPTDGSTPFFADKNSSQTRRFEMSARQTANPTIYGGNGLNIKRFFGGLLIFP